MPAPERTSSGSPASSRRRLQRALTVRLVHAQPHGGPRDAAFGQHGVQDPDEVEVDLVENGRWSLIPACGMRSHMRVAYAACACWRSTARCPGWPSSMPHGQPDRSASSTAASSSTLGNVPPDRTVLEGLREDLRLHRHQGRLRRGRLRRLHRGASARAGAAATAGRARLSLRPVNACIRLLPTLDGKALLTVEDLAARRPAATLHPAQQAMVECHGSQCGFCTPGLRDDPVRHVREPLRAGGEASHAQQLARTSCRATCAAAPATGRSWTPAQRMFELPAGALDDGADRSRSCEQLRSRRAAARRRRPRGPTGVPFARRARWTSCCRAARRAPAGAAAGRLHRRRPVGHQAAPRPRRSVLDVTRASPSCAASRPTPHHIAHRRRASPWTDAFAALVARAGPQLHDAWPTLRRPAGAQRRHAGRQRRQRLADRRLDAAADRAGRAAWCCAQQARRTRAAAAGGLLHRLRAERAGARRAAWPGSRCRCPQPGAVPARLQDLQALRRRHLGACCLAIRAGARRRPGRARVGIGAGGMAATPVRARQTEAALRRPALDRGHACRRAQPRCTPTSSRISDMRASAAYRRAGAGQPAAALLAGEPGRTAITWRSAERAGRTHDVTATGLSPGGPAMTAAHRRPPRSPGRAGQPRLRSAARVRTRARAPQVAGTATYIDDMPELRGHAARGAGPVARGARPPAAASTPPRPRALPGVRGVVLAGDIPGDPVLATFVHDEPVLAQRHGAAPRPGGRRWWSPTPRCRRAAPPAHGAARHRAAAARC